MIVGNNKKWHMHQVYKDVITFCYLYLLRHHHCILTEQNSMCKRQTACGWVDIRNIRSNKHYKHAMKISGNVIWQNTKGHKANTHNVYLEESSLRKKKQKNFPPFCSADSATILASWSQLKLSLALTIHQHLIL